MQGELNREINESFGNSDTGCNPTRMLIEN